MSAVPREVPDAGQPADADDLVAEAQLLGLPATRRLVTSWTSAGLLCSPAFRKSTRHGSAARLYPPAQRQLFIILLQVRSFCPASMRRSLWQVLLSTVIWVWLHQLLPLPTSQIQRTLRTFMEADGKHSATIKRRGIQMLLDMLAHPSASARQRRTAVAVIEQATRTHDWDLDLMESALIEVCSPWPAPPGQRVERGLLAGDGRHFGIPEVIEIWRTGLAVAAALRAEAVPEHDLETARKRYLVRHGNDDLRIAAAWMDGLNCPSDHPIMRSVAFLLLEVGHVRRVSCAAGGERPA